jgi:starch-binding outer membrane protein, SusD/RagB family
MTHLTHMRRVLLPLLLAGTASCKSNEIINTNNPSIDQLTGSPTAATVATAAQGMLISIRNLAGTYAQTAGIFGREVYNLDPSEPRTVNGFLVGPLEPGGFGIEFGFTNTFRGIRAGEAILTAADQLESLSAAQKEAIRGYVKTMQAYLFLGQALVRDDLGLPIAVSATGAGEPEPVVAKAAVYANIIRLLDEAKAHLAAGGTTFPFRLHSGFAGFDTPTTFLRFNRALKARVEIYTKGYPGVLTSLTESFINTSNGNRATLDIGAYHVFSTASGDAANTLSDVTPRAIVVVPSFLTDAQRRPDNSVDLRASSKAVVSTTTLSQQGVSSNLRNTLYPTNSTPVAIIRNEELILLRAEARWFTGDKAGAIADINFIRTNSGGLAPTSLTAGSSDDQFVTELLYNRRYSLFFEYGHRWWDARRFNRLNTLDKALSTHRIFPYIPYPADECLARNPQPANACTQVAGV